jgi:hypothetical protein
MKDGERGEAVLEHAEHSLGTPAGFGRIGRDVLDAELGEGATDVGKVVLVDLAASGRGLEVMAAAIGVEGAEQAMLVDYRTRACETTHRALFLDQEGRVDATAFHLNVLYGI